MKVLMVAAEVVPFAKTGGLADVAGVLPKFLHHQGHDTRVVMPLYGSVSRSNLRRIGGPLGVPMGRIGELWCAVWEGRLPESPVPIYFIEYDQYYDRPHPYTEPDGTGYADNDNRFVLLSRAALQLCKMLNWAPDVVHANDWHTAAVPVFLNTHYANDPLLGRAASVLTVHNMQYQGQFYAGLMDVLDIGWHHYNHLGLEHHGQTNLLKGGIYHATLWNAVSPRYAWEIQSPEFGHGLEGVSRNRGMDLRGILNGTDYDDWNPEVDRHLPANYSAEDLSGKAECKAALQAEMGLPVRPDVPLIGIISRLVHQKGIDLLAAVLPEILTWNVQFVLLGSGERWAHEHFARLDREGHPNFACHLGYSNPLAHRIEAACDLYVMPSRFEPCGLNQLYSLRYGTLPVVHAVGGLDDTVSNFDLRRDRGTGFKFSDLNPAAIQGTLGWAVQTYFEQPAAFRRMQVRAMNQRFSWQQAATEYTAMYEAALARKR
jgi:starch synthase